MLLPLFILLSNGNWSAPAYGGNYLKTKRNGKENTVKIQTTLNEPYLKAKTQSSEFPFFFIGGVVVSFTSSPWSSLLGRIPDKNDHCAFTRDSRGEVMIFFEKNKVFGVEPNRILNILERI